MKFKVFIYILFFINTSIYASTNIYIRHTPITRFSYPGKHISFRAIIITNNCSIASVKFLYRSTGDEYFITNSMNIGASSSNYIYNLTNESITKKDIDYFILVYDNFGNIYREPVESDGYYRINIDSKESSAINPVSGGSIILSDDIPEDDKKTALIVPADAMIYNNTFGIEYFSEDIIDTVLKNDNQVVSNNTFIDTGMTPVAMYDFYKDNNGVKEMFSFRKDVTLYMRYFDEDDDGIVDGTSYDESSLKVFYWDNVTWRYINSTLEANNNVLIVNTDFIARFAIFYVTKTISDINKRGSVLDYVSNPSFCPLDGGIVKFGLKNSVSNYTITVYDLRGNIIRTLKTSSWDGRNDNGEIVGSGVYLYKIETDNDTITGMLNVIQ